MRCICTMVGPCRAELNFDRDMVMKIAFFDRVRRQISMESDLDLQILSAVQVNPRISWTRLASILSVDASTISRRWNRMTEERVVWTTCFAAPRPEGAHPRYAFIELNCAPGRREDLIEALTGERRVYSVNCTSGSRDLFLVISGLGLAALDRFIDERITSLPGVTGSRTHFVQAIHLDGPSSRLHRLDGEQIEAVRRTLPARDRAVPMTPAYLELIAALAGDVRRPVSDVQRQVGRSLSSVSRGIETLLRADWARWRVDLAHDLMGWAAEAMVWLRADHPDIDHVVASIVSMPHIRLCASVVGEANLVASFWLKDLPELEEIERRLLRKNLRLRVVDRWIIPRVAKRTGHVLDREGRWHHFVPIGDFSA